jgi:hypothetical protein
VRRYPRRRGVAARIALMIDALARLAITLTADIYSHVAPEQKREAADRLDAALNW